MPSIKKMTFGKLRFIADHLKNRLGYDDLSDRIYFFNRYSDGILYELEDIIPPDVVRRLDLEKTCPENLEMDEERIEIEYRQVPDGYRGDLCCVEIITPHDIRLHRNFYTEFNGEIWWDIIIDGKVVARERHVHGNGGRGGDAYGAIVALYPHRLKLVV